MRTEVMREVVEDGALAKILIMEDEADQAAMLYSYLSNAGHEVVITYNGDEAWDHLSTHPCDVLLTDMSVKSEPNAPRNAGGLSLIGKVRAAKQAGDPAWFTDIRIVAISGVTTIGANVLRMAKALGADACLGKPVSLVDILKAIEPDRPGAEDAPG